MNIELVLMSDSDVVEFKENIQYAFQKGFEDMFGKCDETILPEKDIDQSLNGKGATAYKAVLDGETVGGVIVAINDETQHNHLDLLYVKSGTQGKGIGKLRKAGKPDLVRCDFKSLHCIPVFGYVIPYDLLDHIDGAGVSIIRQKVGDAFVDKKLTPGRLVNK